MDDVNALPPPYAEEGVLHHEVARGSLTYRRFSAPGRYSSWAREPARWTVVITKVRLLVTRRGYPMVNVAWTDRRIQSLECLVDKKKLVIRADVARFHADWRGTIEVRARCADPDAVLMKIERIRAEFR
jgi:hypothetical protein